MKFTHGSPLFTLVCDSKAVMIAFKKITLLIISSVAWGINFTFRLNVTAKSSAFFPYYSIDILAMG